MAKFIAYKMIVEDCEGNNWIEKIDELINEDITIHRHSKLLIHNFNKNRKSHQLKRKIIMIKPMKSKIELWKEKHNYH